MPSFGLEVARLHRRGLGRIAQVDERQGYDVLTLGVDGRWTGASQPGNWRTCDPGRFRVRLIKQAVSDMRETTERAARADELEQELAAGRRWLPAFGDRQDDEGSPPGDKGIRCESDRKAVPIYHGGSFKGLRARELRAPLFQCL